MDRRFGYYVFGGLLIGAVFGSLWGGSGSALPGIVIGALVGVAIGWFAAAYAMEKNTKTKKGK